MSYEKDKLDSYVTSASLSTALAPYVTSNSLSAAIAGINLAPYVTSNSLSAAVATDALTVRGAANVSATLSAAAVTVAGRPVGPVLLGYQPLTGTQSARFSGSWADFCILDLSVFYRTESGVNSTRPINVYTDGGTTPFLSIPNTGLTASAGLAFKMEVSVHGGDGLDRTLLMYSGRRENNVTQFQGFTVTANSSIVNCIEYISTATMTSGYAALYGWRKA
jgi:hypothetical protein